MPFSSACTFSTSLLAPRRLVESCIRPLDVDRGVDGDDLLDVEAVVSPTRGHSLPSAHVIMPKLLGTYLSCHPSTYLCANEASNITRPRGN